MRSPQREIFGRKGGSSPRVAWGWGAGIHPWHHNQEVAVGTEKGVVPAAELAPPSLRGETRAHDCLCRGGYEPRVMPPHMIALFLMRVKTTLCAPKALALGCTLCVRVVLVHANIGHSTGRMGTPDTIERPFPIMRGLGLELQGQSVGGM